MDEHKSIDGVLKAVVSCSKYTVPKGYMSEFHKAYLTFLFQVVYNPDTKSLVYLSQPSETDFYGKMLLDMEDKTFLGDLNRTDDTQNISEESAELGSDQKANLNSQSSEGENQNDQSNENSENEELNVIKDIPELSNKIVLSRKPST